jgi:hypothetical protein
MPYIAQFAVLQGGRYLWLPHAGRCAICRAAFNPGQRMVRDRRGFVRHIECAEGEA